MGTISKTQISYVAAFAALGRFIEKEELSDVCVMEFVGGVIVTGSKFFGTGDTMNRHTVTHTLSDATIARLVKER